MNSYIYTMGKDDKLYFPLSPPFPLPLKQFLIAWEGGTCVVNNIISFQLHSSLKSWLTFTFCFNIKRDNILQLANICVRFQQRPLNWCLLHFFFVTFFAFVCLFVTSVWILFVCNIVFDCWFVIWIYWNMWNRWQIRL